MTAVPGPLSEAQRLDKWLVFARFVKTRAMARDAVAAGRVRINGEKCGKPDRAVRPGDVLTLALGRDVAVIRVIGAAARRGPPAEARLLYAPVSPGTEGPEAPGAP